MSEFKKISTVAELTTLSSEETMQGYWHGIYGGSEPGSDKSRSFHHGWRNGRVDGGFAEPDAEQISLAAELSIIRQEGLLQ
jgi:hypothetical protein